MFKNAVEIIDIFGFKIRIDPSWLLIAALIVWSLSSSYFPNMVPGLSFYDYVALGTISMLGLFISLILHELSHSLMARQFGLKVGNITLFIFGGVAELEQEPKSPKSEFWIAIVGPAMSFFLSALAAGIAAMLGTMDVSKPLTAVFEYLAFINFILAAFNLVPAFPLDGGRIFRAALWRYKGDIFPATKIASSFGSAFGFLLIVSGIFSVFSTNSIGGLWQILIGFFVVSASGSSYRQLQISAALKNQTVKSLMTTPVFTADVEDTVQSVINDVILRRNVTFVPVVEGNHLLGYVSTSLLQNIDRENWSTTRLSDVYVASSPDNTVITDAPVEDVFSKMVKNDQRKFLVAEDGKLAGIIALSDLMTYLAIQNGLGLQPDHHPLDGHKSVHRNQMGAEY